jgi:uncharacterized protein (DUF2249 family)
MNTSFPEPTMVVALDVRPVEPRDRFETIMGAYEALPVNGVMELTVDHDPRCMYYTLRATRSEAFEFEYLEHGPEVWRVRVVRRKVDPETDGGGAAGAGGGYPAE